MTEQPSALELRLRATLVDLRPADGPSRRLRDLVAGIPDGMPPNAAPIWLRTLGFAAAAVVLAVLLESFDRVLDIPDGGGGPVTPATGIDPSIEGPGLVTSTFTTLPVVSLAIATLFGFVALRLALAGGRIWPRAWALVPALLSIAAIGLLRHPGPGVGDYNAWGPSLGIRVADTSDVTGEFGRPLDTFYVIAESRQPFVFSFVVHNPGPLPLRLEGIVEDPEASIRIAPRWTALALGTDSSAIGQPVAQLVPFTPVELPAGGDLPVYVVGKASPCAVGPGFGGPDQAFAVRGPEIQLAYSVLGLSSIATYQMPMQIEEPIRNGCTG